MVCTTFCLDLNFGLSAKLRVTCDKKCSKIKLKPVKRANSIMDKRVFLKLITEKLTIGKI